MICPVIALVCGLATISSGFQVVTPISRTDLGAQRLTPTGPGEPTILSRPSLLLYMSGNEETSSPKDSASFGTRVRNYFRGPDDGLTFRQRLRKMGLAVALSYGWVSNMSYTVTVSLAWYIHCKRTALSPLAPGQWPKFLAVYAGFYLFNNIVRPVRLAMSVAVSPQFDKIVLGFQKRLGISKGKAIAITVFLANVVCTAVLMGLGILLAATVAGVPVFVPK